MYLVHTVSAVWLRRRQCMHPVHWLVHPETAPGAQWSAPYQCWYASSPLLKPHEETLSQPTYRNRSFRSQLSSTVWLQQAQWLLCSLVSQQFKNCYIAWYTDNSRIVIESGNLTTSTAVYVDKHCVYVDKQHMQYISTNTTVLILMLWMNATCT